jgi:hypothetical protein
MIAIKAVDRTTTAVYLLTGTLLGLIKAFKPLARQGAINGGQVQGRGEMAGGAAAESDDGKALWIPTTRTVCSGGQETLRGVAMGFIG